MSFLSSSRTVLILGDEGLQVYKVGRLSTQMVEFLPWGSNDFQADLYTSLIKRCKKRPVVIINDMVEQHYRKERVPKVGFMDRANVLKRRLGVAFPNYKVRAALKLDDKKSGLPGDSKGLPYLFAAVPSSDNLSNVMRAVQAAGVTIVGFYLLPIEASSMVKTLALKVAGKKSLGRKSGWNIFMGQHHNGGVRQIVTRDGELALTRMSPIVDTDVEPDLWAKEMSSELMATMSYLTRFGYDDSDNLNVFIIGNENAADSLRQEISIDCNINVLSSVEAAKLVGVNLGRQNDLRYADSLHAAYIGKKKKFRLPMQFAAIDSVVKPRRMATFAALGMLATCCYFGYEAFGKWATFQDVKDKFLIVEERKKSIQQDYDLELAKKKEIGFDFLMVSNSVKAFNDIESAKVEPLPLFRKIGQSLGADLHLDNLVVKSKVKKAKLSNPFSYQAPTDKGARAKTYIEAVMSLSFSSEIDPNLGVRKVNDLRSRLEDALPNYSVEVVKQVAGLSHTGNFVGDAGFEEEKAENQDYTAEILLTENVE